MEIQNITRKTKLAKKHIIGRGGKRGTTSGRGTKGQKARSGHRIRPEIRDTIKKIPKMRGRGKNINTSIQTKAAIVSLALLTKFMPNGGEVTPQSLVDLKVIRARGGLIPAVKILATGELKVKLNVSGCAVSTKAKEVIEQAGGTVK